MSQQPQQDAAEEQKNRGAALLASLIQAKATIFSAMIVAATTLVGVYFSRQPVPKQPEPQFVVNSPLLNPYERRLHIEADNEAAKRKDPLHIRYDGTEFKHAGIPLPYDFIWSVDLETLLSKYQDFLKDGSHTVEVRFSGGPWSEPKEITLSTKQAPMAAEINTSADEPETTNIVGAVKAQGTDPKETLRVNLYFNHYGEPAWAPLDVTRKININTGEAHFIFATDVLKIPQISPDDPRYEQDFFILEMIDRAGTTTRHTLSYNAFVTPGKYRYGAQGPKESSLIELVRGWHGGNQSEFIAEFKFIPVTRPISEDAQEHPAFRLTVNQYVQDLKAINKLRWTALPPSKQRDQPLTIILRNDQQIASTFGNQFSDDKAPPPGDKTRYQLVQQGSDGVFYKSNTVESPFPAETFKLIVQVLPEDSKITLLNIKIPYVPGVELSVGDYVVEVARAGYESVQRNVTIVDRDITLTVKLELEEKKYNLTINATPADSRIRIMNIKPVYRRGMELSPGPYEVLVDREGYHSWTQRVEIRDKDLTFNVVLQEDRVTANEVPRAKLSGPTSGVVNQPLSFNGIDSEDIDGTITAHKWDFGDGTTSPSTSSRVTHRYARPGTYTVQLIVEDDRAATGSTSQQVVISLKNRTPRAKLSGPTSGVVNQLLSFSGIDSEDIDGTITAHKWDFGDGTTSPSTSSRVTHRYARPGTYTVQLIVEDDRAATGSTSQQVVISLKNRTLSAKLSGSASGVVNQLLSFSAVGSSDPDGTINTYKWDFGDGKTAAFTFPRTTHRYDKPGIYLVKLTVEGDRGATSSTSQQVVISEEQKMSIATTILFDTGKSDLRPDGIAQLEALLQAMLVDSDLVATIVGYADNHGTYAYLLADSARRAQTVADYLVEGGISQDRLRVKWRGDSAPTASSDTPEGRKENRRVEIVVSNRWDQ